jgi:hypothetical protein
VTLSDLEPIGGASILTSRQLCSLRNTVLLAQIIDTGVAQCADDRKNGHDYANDYAVPCRYGIVTKVEDKRSDN